MKAVFSIKWDWRMWWETTSLGRAYFPLAISFRRITKRGKYTAPLIITNILFLQVTTGIMFITPNPQDNESDKRT